ncbi:MAG: hypothetical protein GX464_10915, partial [Holophagae bacterium]|nr:hypothetical protein [Holophagae bacterium]
DSLERIGQMPYNYGQTRIDVKFPLLDPDALLATSSEEGISRKVVFMAPSWGIFPDGWPEHLPKQEYRNYPNCQSPDNPCPAEVLLNRYVTLVAHETAHGLGIVTPTQYLAHGAPPVPASLNSFKAYRNPVDGAYTEEPAPEDPDGFHEPLLEPQGFGVTSSQANSWLMTWGLIRWNNTLPFEGASYDTNPDPGNSAWQPVRWLMFDRPLRFSLSTDYLLVSPPRVDRSIQRFLDERVPLCQLGRRECR